MRIYIHEFGPGSSTRSPEHHHHYRVWVAFAQTTHDVAVATSRSARFVKTTCTPVRALWSGNLHMHATSAARSPSAPLRPASAYARQLLFYADLYDSTKPGARVLWRRTTYSLILVLAVSWHSLYGTYVCDVQVCGTVDTDYEHSGRVISGVFTNVIAHMCVRIMSE